MFEQKKILQVTVMNQEKIRQVMVMEFSKDSKMFW